MKRKENQTNALRRLFSKPRQAQNDQKVHPDGLMKNSASCAKSGVSDWRTPLSRKEVECLSWLAQAAQENLDEGPDAS